MKRLNAFMDITTLISAVLLVVVLGSLMHTVTDASVWNASRNGSGALSAIGTLLPLLIVIAVVVSFLKLTEHDG